MRGIGLGIAGFLEGAEFFEGGGEGSAEVGFVALEAVEGVGFIFVGEEGVGEVVRGLLWSGFLLVVVEEGEEVGF